MVVVPSSPPPRRWGIVLLILIIWLPIVCGRVDLTVVVQLLTSLVAMLCAVTTLLVAIRRRV